MRRRDYDERTSSWFDQSLDIETRTLYMGSIGKTVDDYEPGVDNQMAEYFIKGMYLLEKHSAEKEINIIMNNPGGDWIHGMAIFDAIHNSTCYCTIKVYGHAMSMGSIILQAADHRIMMPNSRFMIHYGYNGMSGHAKIFEKWSEEGKRLHYEMENLYISRMLEKIETDGIVKYSKSLSTIMNRQKKFEIPPAENVNYTFSKSVGERREQLRTILREMLNFDTILNAEETVMLGLADEAIQKL